MAGWTRLWQFVSCKEKKKNHLLRISARMWEFKNPPVHMTVISARLKKIRGRRWRCLRMVINSSSQLWDTSWSAGEILKCKLPSQNWMSVCGRWLDKLSVHHRHQFREEQKIYFLPRKAFSAISRPSFNKIKSPVLITRTLKQLR